MINCVQKSKHSYPYEIQKTSVDTFVNVFVDLASTTCKADNFMWLPKEHMCVLVYLVTISHSMQAGYMEKAQKYSEKALAQVEKMKSK